jgi:hypothetical protein
MAEQDWNINENDAGKSHSIAKRQYQDPAFRHERVFETMALSCGKIEPTQFQCHFHQKSS